MLGSDLNPASRTSSPVRTALTPGCASARAASSADDFGVRAVGAQKDGMQLAREVPIGGVAAVPGNKAKIFAARHGFFSGMGEGEGEG